MTITDSEITLADLNLNHITWADDENESLCGLDVTNSRWIGPDETVDCPKCIEIDEICAMWEGREDV